MDEKTGTTSLKRGMPPEQTNGLFGAEDRIMGLGVKGRFTMVVTGEVADIIHSDADGTARPVIEFAHIEPIWDVEGQTAARGAQEASYKDRTGANQLNFEGLATDAPNDPDNEQATRDVEFEPAAPATKGGKK